MSERLVALVLLLLVAPSLLWIWLVLHMNSDQPVLVTDELPQRDGGKFCMHRFRTTGQGSRAFHAIGRFLRSCAFDEMPALWDVVRGQVNLRQLFQLARRK